MSQHDSLHDLLDGSEGRGSRPAADLDPAVLADHLLLDALLLREHGEFGSTSELVDAALADVRTSEGAAAAGAPLVSSKATAPRLRLLPRALAGALATAAALLLFLWTSAPSALATVERARAAAESGDDRTYVIEREGLIREGAVARVTVRGREGLLLEVDTPAGTLVTGYDGGDSWLIPPLPGLPVIEGDSPGRLTSWLLERDLDIPFLHVASALADIDESWELTLESGPRPGLETVRGERSGGRGRRPTEFVLEAREADGVLERLDLIFGEGGPRPGLRRLSFFLVDTGTKPAGFYAHEAHHRSGRPVLRR